MPPRVHARGGISLFAALSENGWLGRPRSRIMPADAGPFGRQSGPRWFRSPRAADWACVPASVHLVALNRPPACHAGGLYREAGGFGRPEAGPMLPDQTTSEVNGKLALIDP